jgi:hypothetical protein
MYSQLQEEAVEAGAPADASAHAHETVRPSLASLKAEIARAMQVAADHERERIDAGIGEEETAQVEKIFGRASAEAAELSRHADQDVSLVNAWYKDEVKRIRAEADRQVDDRRTRLEQSLTHHGSLIEAEIESVHVAVEGYRASLGAFFGRLSEERDPSAIARLAGDLPDPPDLDGVRGEARAAAMQALVQASAETADPVDKSQSNGNGRNGRDREPVPVMDQDTAAGQTGSLTGTAVVAAAPVATTPADHGAPSPEPSDTDAEAPPAEAASSDANVANGANVASRLVRAFTKWTSPTGAADDR